VLEFSAGFRGTIQLIGGRGGDKNPNVAPATGGFNAAIQVGGGGGATYSSGVSHGGNGGSITLVPGSGGTGTASAGSAVKVLLAPTGGKIGIGTSTPTATLTVVAGATTLADHWTTRSSRAFKTDIQPLQDALTKVERLQGVSYKNKADGKHEIGVVADDVEQVVPEVVSRDPQTNDVQGVDYARLTALLIEAVKAQQAQLRSQQKEIHRLEAKLEGHASAR
jgi:Chaperone of endosialidase